MEEEKNVSAIRNMPSVTKNIHDIEDNSQYSKQYERYASSFFDGLSGLKKEDREQWEKEYFGKINGRDDVYKEKVFQDGIFKHFFEGKDDWRGKAYENRHNLTRDQRNNLVAKAMSEHLIQDDLSRSKYEKYGLTGMFSEGWRRKNANWREHSLGYKADEYLSAKQAEYLPEFVDKINAMDDKQQDDLLKSLDVISRENSNYYRRYEGTARLDESREQKLLNAAKLMAAQKAAGEDWAVKELNDIYQDKAAESQSFMGAVGNGFAGAGTIIVGGLIHTAGMILGTGAGIFSYDPDSDENRWQQFLNSVIDNPLSRYGTNIATTQSFNPSKQEHYLEEGISALPILKTRAQENQLLSIKTIAELVQQSGYVAEFALTSYAGGAALKGLSNLGTKLVTKNVARNFAKQAAKGSFAEKKAIIENGRKAIELLNSSEKIAQKVLPGAVGGAEGAMNALQTYDESVESLKSKINKEYDQRVLNDIENEIASNPSSVLYAIGNAGYDISGLLPKLGTPDPETGIAVSGYTKDQYEGMKNIILSNPQLIDIFSSKYTEEKEQALNNAENYARQAMRNDFWFNSIVNGFVNTTLLKPLIVNPTRRILNGKKNPLTSAINVVKNEDGTWSAIAKNATRKDFLKDQFKVGLGESLEEYIPNITSYAEQAASENKMKQYLEFTNGDTEEGKAFDLNLWESFTAGLEAANERLVSKDAIREGLYGGIAAMFIPKLMPNASRARGKRNENESMFDYLERNSPVKIDLGVFNAIFNREGKQQTKENKLVADKINEFFNDKQFQDIMLGTRAGMNWSEEYEKAIQNDDEKDIRDAVFGSLVNKIVTLNNLKGTQYYDAVMNSMNARMDFNKDNLQNPESEELRAVEILRGDGEADVDKNLNNEELLDKIKKEAKDFLDIHKKIEEEQSSVEKMFGKNMDNDVKNAIIYNRLAINDMKERISQLDDEIKQISDEINKESGKNSGGSESLKRMTVLIGNRDNFEKHLSDINEELKELTKIKEEINDKIKNEKDESEIASLKDKLNVFNFQEKELLKRKNDLEEINKLESKNIVLSAREIFELSPDLRSEILYGKKDKYSDEQIAEIDKVVRIGTNRYNDFSRKIKDQGRLLNSLIYSMSNQLDIMSNPASLSMYSMNAKIRSKIAFEKNKHKDLIDLDKNGDYVSVKRRLDDIIKRGDITEQTAVESLLNGTESYNRWINENNIKTDIKGNLLNDNLDNAQKNTLDAALDYMLENGMDPYSENNIGILQEKEFNDYIENRKLENPDSEFLKIEEIAPFYKEKIDKVLNKKEEERQRNEGVVNAEHSEPSINGDIEKPKPVITRNDDKKNKDKDIVGLFEDRNIKNVVKEIIQKTNDTQLESLFRKAIEDISGLNISDLETFKNELSNAYGKIIDEKISQESLNLTQEEKDLSVEIFKNLDNEIKKIKDSKQNSIPKRTKTDVKNEIDSIEEKSIRISDLTEQQKEYYKKYEIDNELYFEIKPGDKVYYITDNSIDNQIVMVVESRLGKIEINGKKYQPIGFLNTESNTKFSKNIKNIAKKQASDKIVMLTKYNKPISDLFISDEREKIEFLPNEKVNNVPIHDAVRNSIQDQVEREAYDKKEDGDKKEKSSYDRRVRDFMEKLYVGKTHEGKDILILKNEGQDIYVFPDFVSDSKSKNGIPFNKSFGGKEKLEEYNTVVNRMYRKIISDGIDNKNVFDIIRQAFDINAEFNIDDKGLWVGSDLIAEKGKSNHEFARNIVYGIFDAILNGKFGEVRWSVPFTNIDKLHNYLNGDKSETSKAAYTEWNDIYNDNLLYVSTKRIYNPSQGVTVRHTVNKQNQSSSSNPTNQPSSSKIDPVSGIENKQDKKSKKNNDIKEDEPILGIDEKEIGLNAEIKNADELRALNEEVNSKYENLKEETKKYLKTRGISESQWNELKKRERRQLIICK